MSSVRLTLGGPAPALAWCLEPTSTEVLSTNVLNESVHEQMNLQKQEGWTSALDYNASHLISNTREGGPAPALA